MTVDELIEKGAERLEQTSARLAGGNGFKARLRQELVEDAQFLRKLKPSAIASRVHGERPPEDTGVVSPAAAPKPARSSSGGGPSPLLVIAGAFVAGYLLAKAVDWRGHAHPRL